METISQYAGWISAIVNVLLIIAGGWIMIKKAIPEVQKIRSESSADDASAVESYAHATQMYADELKTVREEMRTLRKELDTKDSIIKQRDEIIAERDKIILGQRITIDDVTDWADRLVHQVKSLGGIPVPFRSAKENTTPKQ